MKKINEVSAAQIAGGSASVDNSQIRIVRYSKKGAALITDGKVEAWVKPSIATKIEEGNITPSVSQSLANAYLSGKSTGNKIKCYNVAFSSIKAETEKAVLLVDFSNKEAWFPKSAIVGNGSGEKSDHFIIKAFAIEGKNFDHKASAIWIEA